MKKLRTEKKRGKDASGKIIGASKTARGFRGRKKSEHLLRAALKEVGEMKAALVELAEKNKELAKRAAEKMEKDQVSALLESEKQFLAVSERERQRFGADLHDNLGQQLTAIEFLCQALREDLRGQPPLEEQMGQICRFLQESVAQTRQLARGLMPVSLDAEGLEDALAEMIRRMNQGPIQCEFVCTSPVKVWDNSIANHLFHIAQEAVNNAIKHSKARKVTVSLSQRHGTVLLQVEDDGRGYPEATEASDGNGLGLQIMRHRANVIGATLETQSIPGKGVTVACTLRRHG